MSSRVSREEMARMVMSQALKNLLLFNFDTAGAMSVEVEAPGIVEKLEELRAQLEEVNRSLMLLVMMHLAALVLLLVLLVLLAARLP